MAGAWVEGKRVRGPIPNELYRRSGYLAAPRREEEKELGPDHARKVKCWEEVTRIKVVARLTMSLALP